MATRKDNEAELFRLGWKWEIVLNPDVPDWWTVRAEHETRTGYYSKEIVPERFEAHGTTKTKAIENAVIRARAAVLTTNVAEVVEP